MANARPVVPVQLLTRSDAQSSFILFVTCALIGVHYGTGRHHADLADEDIKQAMKVSCSSLARLPGNAPRVLTRRSIGGGAIYGTALQ